MAEYTAPICNKCSREIKFVPLRLANGTIKTVPCEPKDVYIILRTEEKTEKGQFIYNSVPSAVTHNCQEG